MKKVFWFLAALTIAGTLLGQTATPTRTNTATPTSTRTPTPSDPTALVSLIVSAGSTASSAIYLNGTQAYNVTVWAPGTIDTSATIQINYQRDNDTGWQNYQSPAGTDVTVAASKAVTIIGVQAAALRINEGGSAGSARTFQVLAARMTK